MLQATIELYGNVGSQGKYRSRICDVFDFRYQRVLSGPVLAVRIFENE